MISISNPLSSKLTPMDNQLIRSNAPLPKGSNAIVWIVAGRRGCGKTTMVLRTLSNKDGYRKHFNNIFIVSPTGKHDPKMSKLIDEIELDNNFYEKLNNDTIIEIIEKNKRYLDESPDCKNLLLLDDCMSDLPPSTTKGAFNDLIILSRHYHLSIFIVSQRYIGVSRVVRSNADLISFYHTDNKREFENLRDDLNVNEDKLKMLYEYATNDSCNSFLHINLMTNPITYYKKFDRILE